VVLSEVAEDEMAAVRVLLVERCLMGMKHHHHCRLLLLAQLEVAVPGGIGRKRRMSSETCQRPSNLAVQRGMSSIEGQQHWHTWWL
jgi:hypothetical protein